VPVRSVSAKTFPVATGSVKADGVSAKKIRASVKRPSSAISDQLARQLI
jgi:hypothetical protein